jgi:hypothetical protein
MGLLRWLKRFFSVTSSEKSGQAMLRILFWFLIALPFLGLVAQMASFTQFIDLTNGIPFWKEPGYWITCGYGLLIAGAAYLGGGFTGFLFGLPRMLTNPDQAKKDHKKDYSRNDNLIQISDWVTKIIVGLGLTNLYALPGIINRFGEHYGSFFPIISQGTLGNGALIAECIMIFYSISGFLMGYLWTNIHYIPVLTLMDGITEGLRKKQALAEEMNEIIMEGAENVVDASDMDSYERVKANQSKPGFQGHLLSFEQFNALVSKAEQRMSQGKEAQSGMPVELSDPNKNYFGGQQEREGRRLTANVTEIGDNGLYRVNLSVVGTTEEARMKDGEAVVFALHPTFRRPVRVVHASNGRASLELIAYGAFTVGVVCSTGDVLLEYDLSTLPGAPKGFVEN